MNVTMLAFLVVLITNKRMNYESKCAGYKRIEKGLVAVTLQFAK